MVNAYLDTSALVKRYVEEKGTELIDFLFSKISPDHKLVISIWNLSECMVALDKYRQRKVITDEKLKELVRELVIEVRKLWGNGSLRIVPLHPELLVETWPHILNQHIYAGDAIQLVTFSRARCDFLLSSDKRLLQICKQLGIECYTNSTR